VSETEPDIVERRRAEIGRWTGFGLGFGVLIAVIAFLAGTDDISPFFSSIGVAAALGAIVGVIRYRLAKRAA